MTDIDLSRASFVVIQVGVYEHEQEKLGANSREWPDAIRRMFERELAAWRQRNPGRAIVGPTRSFVIAGQCSVEFHHVDKSELPPAGQVSGETAPPPHAMPAAAPNCMRCSE